MGRKVPEGEYPKVFAYFRDTFPEVNNLHYWGFHLWDSLIVTAAFHDPHCECPRTLSCGGIGSSAAFDFRQARYSTSANHLTIRQHDHVFNLQLRRSNLPWIS